MKTRFISSITTVAADRPVLLLLLALITSGIAYIIYAAVSLNPSELQIATHYSAFGDTNYYRDRWHYTISFVVFALIMTFVHASLVIKLHLENLRDLSIAFAWLSIGLVFICVMLTGSVLGMAV